MAEFWEKDALAEQPPAQQPAGEPAFWTGDETITPAPQQPQPAREGGLMQTVPQAIDLLSSPEGRDKLWEGVKKFPGDFAQGMIDFFKTPGKAYSEGVTPEEEVSFGLNAALGMIGGGAKFPRIAAEAIVPHMQEFEASVLRPVAEKSALDMAAEATQQERIQAAAMRSKEGGLFVGPTHGDAGVELQNAGHTWDVEATDAGSGFVTNTGRFVDRDEALHIAQQAEQHKYPELVSPDSSLHARDVDFDPVDDIARAREVGVIGPDVPPPANETPAASAQRAIPASRTPDDKITMTPAGEPIESWEQRFNQWVDKIDTPEDFKAAVRQMATETNNFPEARAGNVAPEQVAKVAEAAGLDAAAIDGGKLRTQFRNDDEIRIVTQLLKKLADDVQTSAETVRTADTPENLAKFQAAIIKRDYALEATLEHTVALRAEWGRSGNALKEILAAQNDQATLTKILGDKGRSIDDLRDIARGMQGLDREQAAKVLTGMRGQPAHWFYWMWVQGLISGLVTHTKYVAANGLYAEMERGLVTPLAAVIGKMKDVAGVGSTDRAFFGEVAASHWGTIAAVPDAVRAAYQTAKTGLRVPLESEKQLHDLAIAAGEKPPAMLARAVNPVSQMGAVDRGIWDRIIPNEAVKRTVGRIVGAPGDMASAIHTTFKVLGERANLESWAYNKAAAEGLSPTDPQFWERRAYHAANPGEQVLKDTVYQAYKDTFMQELGEHAKKFQSFTKNVPGARWVFPFAHIPINLMKATYEYSPFAVLDKDMRANLTGENGGRAQDMAISRMVVGSSVMAYFTHKYMNGEATGDYPHDQNERKDWQLQQKQANSIRIGDRWVSFDRFGPAGDLARIGANIGSIAHHFAMDRAAPDKGLDQALAHATWATANAAANSIADEVGFQSLRNFMDAIEDERKGDRFAAWQAGSLIPFSSLLSQTASIKDPQMRVAQTFVDGLKYRTPGLRETLLPKRDPLYGEPLANPGYHSVIRSSPVNADPIKIELERVNLHPAAPRDVIGGVKLTPEQYDRYQATAGPLVHRALESLVSHPGWEQVPPAARAETLRATISSMRQMAASAMQIESPVLVRQGLQQRLDYLSGKSPTPRPKRPPELAPAATP